MQRADKPPIEESEPIDAKQLALCIADLIDDRQGKDITILDVSGPLAIADYFVIATVRNQRHARALAHELSQLAKASGVLRRNAAGLETESGWILLDFDEVVVHLFDPRTRDFYGLENLWGDVPALEFTPKEHPADTGVVPGSVGSFPRSAWPDSMGTR